jgi:hypothetical protein
MSRQVLEDGRYFDTSKAEKWEEDRTHDGSNWISDATGSQWEHEKLYRTAGGRWVLRHWSQWQGSRETWAEITNEEAARWLVRCGHEEHPACKAEYAALELQ